MLVGRIFRTDNVHQVAPEFPLLGSTLTVATPGHLPIDDLYYRMSPFSYADRIKEPLLLIHGGADDNQGTFLIQSERFYAALKGNGAKTRLVVMPYEAHRYDARETTNDLLWEWTDWFTHYLR